MCDDQASIEQHDISTQALFYVKKHKGEIIKKFAGLEIYRPVPNPAAYFMAGSPGAGKTEYSKSFIKELTQRDQTITIVRIDADEIRDMLPQYNKKNADELTRASSKGVELLFDYVQDHSQSFLLDGTFSHYDTSYKNIIRSLRKGYKVGLTYVYQEPTVAWRFTKIREKEEGRHVSKGMFINAFLAARNSANRVKAEIGQALNLDLIIKNHENGVEEYHLNVDNVDRYLTIQYTFSSLEEVIRER